MVAGKIRLTPRCFRKKKTTVYSLFTFTLRVQLMSINMYNGAAHPAQPVGCIIPRLRHFCCFYCTRILADESSSERYFNQNSAAQALLSLPSDGSTNLNQNFSGSSSGSLQSLFACVSRKSAKLWFATMKSVMVNVYAEVRKYCIYLMFLSVYIDHISKV